MDDEDIGEINQQPVATYTLDPKYILNSRYTIERLIENVERKMLEIAVNSVIVKINNDTDFSSLVRSGFIPHGIVFSDNNTNPAMFIAHFLEELTEEEEELWFGDTVETSRRYLKKVNYIHYGKYVYANLKGWQEHAMKKALSFPLLLFFPDQLYASKRPVTDMSQFRQVTSALYERSSLRDSPAGPYFKEISIQGSTHFAIPVTRYSDGMSKGLFHDIYDENLHCGTFFYFEPESTTYLTFNTVRIYRNKYDAVQEILPNMYRNKLPSSRRNGACELAVFNAYFENRQSLPADMKMTINEYLQENKSTSTKRRYVGAISGLYAIEDKYDQDLCHYAREAGIDIIILTDMIGSHQIVVEVLDTRSRQISMSNLVFPSSK